MIPESGWFLAALVMFFLAIVGASILVFSTWIVAQQYRAKGPRPVWVDIQATLPDRIALNGALIVCLLIESATLVWDTLLPKHFPILVRWPLVVLVIAVVCTSGLRLFRLYLYLFRHAD